MTLKEFEIQEALGTLTHYIKMYLVRNQKTSKEILTKLSTDKDWSIRCWIAFNPNTPTKILAKLSKDKDSLVKRYAVENLAKKEYEKTPTNN